MDHAVPPSGFTSGMMDVEEQSFTWTIENFRVIRKSKSMINAQKIYFSAGGKVGRPSKWSVYLKKSMGVWIDVYFNIEELSRSHSTWKNAFVQMTLAVEGARDFFMNKGPQKVAASKSGWRFKQICFPTRERLVMKLTFKLYFVPLMPTEACQPTVNELQVMFANRAKKDWGPLLKNPISGNDIKLISMDRKEFSIQKQILEAQSSVLKAMIRTDILEANLGAIQLPEISSRGLKVILTFLSTGELGPEWSETKIIVELTNAAAKYQLQELLEFLDATLGKVCKVENVLALFTLARGFSLKKAEAELLKFIHEKDASSPEIFCKILSGMSVPGDIAAVPFPSLLPKKSRWTLLLPFRMLFGKNKKENCEKC